MGHHSRSALRARLFLAVCCVLSLALHGLGLTHKLHAAPAGNTDTAKHTEFSTAPKSSPWSRVVVIGASATSGFINPGSPDGTNIAAYRFSRYLDAALVTPHEPVRNLGSSFMFLAPTRIAKAQLEKALQADPSMIVALDFLFWFCYGDGTNDQHRLQRFESGLALLDAIRCPLVVGDIPDASAATNTMLRPAQVPTPAVIAGANARLKEWAAKRENVKVVGLAKFMDAANRNDAIHVRDRRLLDTRTLLQKDKLHPSARGAAVLALAIAEVVSGSASDRTGQPVEHAIRWDLETILAAVGGSAN